MSSTLFAGGFDWAFIQNKGQLNKTVNFVHNLPDGNLFLENDRLTYHLYDMEAVVEMVEHGHNDELIQHHAFDVRFVQSNSGVSISQTEETPHYYNYFIGNNKDRWAANVKGYHQVTYQNLYQNVDFVIYDRNNTIKYDFVVKAGADPAQIKMAYNGIDGMFIDQEGRLHLPNSVNEIIEDKPYVYQIINGQKHVIESRYVLSGNQLSFDFPNGYNTAYDLVIDPTLIFSTYSGATQVYGANCSAFDQAGNIYSAGNTPFGGYPVTIGAYQTVWTGVTPAAIQKFDQAGNMLFRNLFRWRFLSIL